MGCPVKLICYCTDGRTAEFSPCLACTIAMLLVIDVDSVPNSLATEKKCKEPLYQVAYFTVSGSMALRLQLSHLQ